jgi:hypothetical protein
LILNLAGIVDYFSQYVRGKPPLVYFYLFVEFITIIICVIAGGGLIYTINQAVLNRSLTFTEAWHQGKAKGFRILGLSFITIIPSFFIYLVIYSFFVVKNLYTSPLLWFIFLCWIAFIESLVTFGVCAIMIDDLKTYAAAKSSFSITLKYYCPVFVMISLEFFIHFIVIYIVAAILTSGLFNFKFAISLPLDLISYQKIQSTPIVAMVAWMIELPLIPFTSSVFTLLYLQFTKKISCPAVINQQYTT